MPKAAYHWQPHEDAPLSTGFHMNIAARMGISEEIVPRRRRKLGIAAFGNDGGRKGTGGRHWTADEDTLLDQISDAEIVRQLG